MIKIKTIFAAVVLASSLAFSPAAMAAGEGGMEAELQNWSFAGLFGTYDTNQLQRGFQVFQEVCSGCHSADLLAFRNLSQEGGLGYTEGQVKALAAEYSIVDPTTDSGERPAIPADRWPSPFETEQDARDSNNGAYPPDFSVLAKARGITQKFPYWAFNYFTAYQEGGPDFIYNVLVHYTDPPHGVEVGDGQYYNAYLGAGISMPPPLADGMIAYEDENIPQTIEQYSHDVAAFMMWMADPHLVSRKEMGFRVLLFLVLFAGMMYLVKRKVWANVEH